MGRPPKLVVNEESLPEGDIAPADEIWLSTKQIKRRYSDPSDMSLMRWQQDPNTLFPPPTKIGRHNFWPLSQIIEFERRLLAKRSAA